MCDFWQIIMGISCSYTKALDYIGFGNFAHKDGCDKFDSGSTPAFQNWVTIIQVGKDKILKNFQVGRIQTAGWLWCLHHLWTWDYLVGFQVILK